MDSKRNTSPQPITRATFAEAANETGTDKCQSHGYHRFYPSALSQLSRSEEFTIIEIGYGNGASIPMWQTLFPSAYIICIDRGVSMEGKGYKVIQADQNEPTSILEAIGAPALPVRLIIDDGSHHPQHQLTSFSALFETVLEHGGQYIIEDIETSYWLAGNLYGSEMRYGLFCKWSAIEAMKLAADYINRKYLSPKDKSLIEYMMALVNLSPSAAANISTITFGQNCVLLRKAEKCDNDYIDKGYNYSAFTHRE